MSLLHVCMNIETIGNLIEGVLYHDCKLQNIPEKSPIQYAEKHDFSRKTKELNVIFTKLEVELENNCHQIWIQRSNIPKKSVRSPFMEF